MNFSTTLPTGGESSVQDEWLSLSKVGLDSLEEANLDLAQWLVEYNNHRPHEALDYQTPLEYAQK